MQKKAFKSSTGWWDSNNRTIYCWLALKYCLSPGDVYRLAHGEKARTKRDVSVLRELLRYGVISKLVCGKGADTMFLFRPLGSKKHFGKG